MRALKNSLKTLILKILDYLKMCLIFVGSLNNFVTSDNDMISTRLVSCPTHTWMVLFYYRHIFANSSKVLLNRILHKEIQCTCLHFKTFASKPFITLKLSLKVNHYLDQTANYETTNPDLFSQIYFHLSLNSWKKWCVVKQYFWGATLWQLLSNQNWPNVFKP